MYRSPDRARTAARRLVPLAFAGILAGCGGGGSTPPTPHPAASGAATTPPIGPTGAIVDPATSYTTAIGTTTSGALAFAIVNLGGTSPLSSSDAAPGATIVYPDGSLQTTNASGAFDASQSAWTAANANALAANPNLNPDVVAFARGPITGATSGQPIINVGLALPAQSPVLAYAPGGTKAPIADTVATLSTVDVIPNAIAITNNQTQIFSAIGRYSDGELAAAGLQNVTWTVSKPSGCGSAAGTIAVDTNDAQRVRYVPPGSGGSFPAGCPDLVVAKASGANGTQLSGSGSAAYYTSSLTAQIGGTLTTLPGTPISGGVVEFYGAGPIGRDAATVTSTSGAFRAPIAYDRILTPAAFVPTTSGTSYVLQGVNPASLDPSTQQSALLTQKWTTTGAPPSPLSAPPADYAQMVRDVEFFGRIAWEPFPFGEPPNADGSAAVAGSLQALLQTPAATAAGTSGSIFAGPYGMNGSDPYQGASYTVDATGNVFTLELSNGAPPYELLTIVRGVTSIGSVPCAATATCFSFTQYRSLSTPFATPPSTNGAMLDIAGGWSQSSSGMVTTISLVQNDYDAGHQTLGSPLFTHRITIAQTLGATTQTVADSVATASGGTIATQSYSRDLCTTTNVTGPCATANALYGYTGVIDRTLVKTGGGSVDVHYVVGSNGPLASTSSDVVFACPQAYCLTNSSAPGTVAFETAIGSSPATSDDGTDLAWIEPASNSTVSGFTGTALAAGTAIAGAAGAAPAATFLTDASGNLTISNTATYGSTISVFPL